jgi:hypothetical protein
MILAAQVRIRVRNFQLLVFQTSLSITDSLVSVFQLIRRFHNSEGNTVFVLFLLLFLMSDQTGYK